MQGVSLTVPQTVSYGAAELSVMQTAIPECGQSKLKIVSPVTGTGSNARFVSINRSRSPVHQWILVRFTVSKQLKWVGGRCLGNGPGAPLI